MTNDKIPVWLDCDPGLDDAIALFYSLYHPNIELVGVSTTYGNASVTNTTYNALSLLTAYGHPDIPVYQGSGKPIVKEPAYAKSIHGETGLKVPDDFPKPVNKAANDEDEDKLGSFSDALWTAVEKHGQELSIVAIGPLTNLAYFFSKYPNAKSIVKRISIMGGGFDGVYNIGKSEFNTHSDPRANNLILSDPILRPKTILIPLNVTHTALYTQEVASAVLSKNTNIRRFINFMLAFFAHNYSKRTGASNGPPVHDLLAVYVLLEEYNIEKLGLEVKTLSLTCVEEQGEDEGKFEYVEDPKGTKVVFALNVEKLWKSFNNVLELSD